MKGNKIKNLGKSLVAIMATLLLAIAATTATSCKDLPWVKGSHEAQVTDSTRFVQQFESIVNPKITDAEEVTILQEKIREDYTTDSVLRTIPKGVLKNVAVVIIKKKGIVSKKDVVQEYQENKQIYDNLPAQNNNPSSTDNGVVQNKDSIPLNSGKKIISTSYKKRTDTINGKPVEVTIKTEESYE